MFLVDGPIPIKYDCNRHGLVLRFEKGDITTASEMFVNKE